MSGTEIEHKADEGSVGSGRLDLTDARCLESFLLPLKTVSGLRRRPDPSTIASQ